MKKFNTTAVCIPSKHYMVDLTERVKEIKVMIDDGKYFTINRARQYGKTTTLRALEVALSSDYDVISVDFQDVTGADFSDENKFTKGLARLFCEARSNADTSLPATCDEQLQELADGKNTQSIKLSNPLFSQA